MLSGGYAPWDNNYSQYLQANAVVGFFERNFPPDSIWVFFGAGNVEGEKPVFCDVRKDVSRGETTLSTWMPGVLTRNRGARREVVLRALREEILPAISDGGTLYLFVGDHGSQNRTSESVIDLWSLRREAASQHGWRSERNSGLSVSELRETLVKGIGKGRVVFCMTQCHSGGFHHLAVPRTMNPNPRWFTIIPSWARRADDPLPVLRAAGFTATDERSLAAGCLAEPDPQHWVGYERFVPEQLLGLDLFTMERRTNELRSFAEAHAASVLVDQTDDKPYATSEQFLERWAALIERMTAERNVTSSIRKHLAVYQKTVDGAAPKERDAAFRERQALFRRFTETLARQNPAARKLLLSGSRSALERAIGPVRKDEALESTNSPADNMPPRQGRRRSRSAQATETQKLWNQVLRPAWQAALENGAVTKIAGAAIDFEKFLLKREAAGDDFFSTITRPQLYEEAFWHAGYSDPATLDVTRADAVMLWGISRRSQIVAWAATSTNGPVRSAAERLAARTRWGARREAVEAPGPVSRKTAAERVLFYRRVLAAWQFLLAVDERPALDRFRELTALERTPFPGPHR